MTELRPKNIAVAKQTLKRAVFVVLIHTNTQQKLLDIQWGSSIVPCFFVMFVLYIWKVNRIDTPTVSLPTWIKENHSHQLRQQKKSRNKVSSAITVTMQKEIELYLHYFTSKRLNYEIENNREKSIYEIGANMMQVASIKSDGKKNVNVRQINMHVCCFL